MGIFQNLEKIKTDFIGPYIHGVYLVSDSTYSGFSLRSDSKQASTVISTETEESTCSLSKISSKCSNPRL